MYERNATVLEKYFEEIFGLKKTNNLKTNYENYNQIIEKTKEYQKILQEEEKVIESFDKIATQIEQIQNKQVKLHEINMKLEEERNQLFKDLGENPNTLDTKLQKIEETLEKNNEELTELREQYVKALVIFTERQKERNKYSHSRRTAEAEHISNIKKADQFFKEIDIKDVQKIKSFLEREETEEQEEIMQIIIQNGKNEKINFYLEVIQKAVTIRLKIAREEAKLCTELYEKTEKFLEDLKNENIKIERADKKLRDIGVKLTFLDAQKEYIVSFLDNERITSMYGKKVHEKLMQEACKNFDLDMAQINNLYELIIKETQGKATKKAYKELYNKTYLKEIEEKQKTFEEEVNSIKINAGTVINSNYWRLDAIKNIYMVFQEEVSEKFNKDLKDYKIEENEHIPYIKEDENLEDEIIDKEEQYKDITDIIEDYEESYNEEDVIVEDKAEKIIKNSRKKEIKKEEKENKGLFKKIFKNK